jgi:hypothetical protein
MKQTKVIEAKESKSKGARQTKLAFTNIPPSGTATEPREGQRATLTSTKLVFPPAIPPAATGTPNKIITTGTPNNKITTTPAITPDVTITNHLRPPSPPTTPERPIQEIPKRTQQEQADTNTPNDDNKNPNTRTTKTTTFEKPDRSTTEIPNNTKNKQKQEEIEPPDDDTQKPATVKNTSELPNNVTDPSKHNKSTDDHDTKNTAEKTNTPKSTNVPEDSKMTTKNDPSKHNKNTYDQDAKNIAEKTNTTKPTGVPEDSEMTTENDPFITVKKKHRKKKVQTEPAITKTTKPATTAKTTKQTTDTATNPHDTPNCGSILYNGFIETPPSDNSFDKFLLILAAYFKIIQDVLIGRLPCSMGHRTNPSVSTPQVPQKTPAIKRIDRNIPRHVRKLKNGREQGLPKSPTRHNKDTPSPIGPFRHGTI